jgi:hypothetical protein
VIRNRIATRDWKPCWPGGTWMPLHTQTFGELKVCISHRPHTWPSQRRLLKRPHG